MTRIVHIVPEIDEANGVWRVASLFAREQGGEVVSAAAPTLTAAVADAGEVWVHGAWLPRLWRASMLALRSGKRLVRMTHGSFSPIYLKRQSPLRKRLVSPIERFFLRRADCVVATCAAEAEWIRAYEPRIKRIEITDIKRFFDLSHKTDDKRQRTKGSSLHILYLGRRHPLKGLQYLEEVVRSAECVVRSAANNSKLETLNFELKVVCSAFGAEKEAAFDWCDVLVLPTLSENFGLVVAEALEHGKRVITTDGAPAWGDGNDYDGRLVYLRGFRDGSDAERVSLLKDAICSLVACKP